jgi:DNA polymerase-3 subunit delta
MGLHKRKEINALLDKIAQGERCQVYLCFGERYLCRQTAEKLEERLLADGGAVHKLDGSVEDTARLLSRLRSLTLLPGLQIYRVTDTTLFHSREVGDQLWQKACKARDDDKSGAAVRYLLSLLRLGSVDPQSATVFRDITTDHWPKIFGFPHPGEDLGWADELISGVEQRTAGGQDPGENLISAIAEGLPPNHLLLLIAEHVDKRKKLFTAIKKHGEVIDCSIAEGSSRAALQQQHEVIREMVQTTLARMNKTIEPAALEMLFERVGFHPVAAVLEIEKVAFYVDERQRISPADVDLLVGRTREDAIFELSEALTHETPARAMAVLDHLLSDGIHPLAIIATLRNYLRRLLIFKSLQARENPRWSSMSSRDFQNIYLPALKQTGVWPDLLKGHPYALYQGFKKAAPQSAASLKKCLGLLLEAEFKLKGSPVPDRLILEELLVSLAVLQRPPAAQRAAAT